MPANSTVVDNSLCIFGILEKAKSNGITDDIAMNLCKQMEADVDICKIDRSHKAGKP
ncbi:hypothetical protein DPMN_058943 [Dreissena polymorpha]|uniref:Uncharacterized protein n=1 Tax=Dreissena polymorpha TaxID=45954 RepID=A0A9D4HG20_DREPO|nr:hypothetical protein DPMN_058943 [Dreissena polymorpha]